MFLCLYLFLCLEQLIGFFTEDFLLKREAKCLEKLVHPLLSILSLLTSPEIDPPLRGGSRFPKVSSLRGVRKTPAKNLAED